ncbi:NAD(P)-dependent dehydrogenase (short-subunit alcohol dehydrogenase family) [Bradyrhizobium sp. USDA 328]
MADTDLTNPVTRCPKLERFGGMTPLGRRGQPVELASIYVQLAAADASYATGQVYGAAGSSGQP